MTATQTMNAKIFQNSVRKIWEIKQKLNCWGQEMCTNVTALRALVGQLLPCPFNQKRSSGWGFCMNKWMRNSEKTLMLKDATCGPFFLPFIIPSCWGLTLCCLVCYIKWKMKLKARGVTEQRCLRFAKIPEMEESYFSQDKNHVGDGALPHLW